MLYLKYLQNLFNVQESKGTLRGYILKLGGFCMEDIWIGEADGEKHDQTPDEKSHGYPPVYYNRNFCLS